MTMPSRTAPTRLRVLHVVSHLGLGGAERVAVTLIDALRAELDFGLYAVRGVGHDAIGESLRDEIQRLGVPLFLGPRVPMRYGGIITGALGLARAVRRFHADVIHLHTEIPEASYAAWLVMWPGRTARPVVRTIHNSAYWEFCRPLGRWCERRMMRSVCATVSQDALLALRRLRASAGAAPFAIEPTVIYNAVPPAAPATPPPSCPPGRLRIVFGGRLENEKGADLLPRIVQQTRVPEGRTCHLSIFGSGTHSDALRAFAASPPAGWTIEVLSPVADFRARLPHYDVAIVPSRFEGLALVAIEATLAGVPLVITDAPGLREALPAEHPWRAKSGDATSFAAALSAALHESPRWPDAVRDAQRLAHACFSLEAMRSGYRRLYEKAAGLCGN